jgi:iron complex transport system substrate-binding protein
LRSRRELAAAALLSLLLLAACSPPAAPTAVATPPAVRIVSLAPSNTEILFAVGAGAQIVGRDELSDYPAEAQQVASIGSTYGGLNAEAILALQPDLILGADITSPEQVQALEDLGLTVFVLANPGDFEGLFANLELAGELTGHAGHPGSHPPHGVL